MKLIELPDLSIGAPSQIAPPRVSQVEMCDLLESARRVKAGSQLVGERLVVNKAVCACRRDGTLVEVHGIERASLDPGNFGAHQRGAVFEILRAILRPDFELPVMRGQSLQMLHALVGRYGVAGCSATKRRVEMIFCLLQKAG